MRIKPYFSAKPVKPFWTFSLLVLLVFAFPFGQVMGGCPRIQKTKWICDGGEYKIRPYKGSPQEGRDEPCVHPEFPDSLLGANPKQVIILKTDDIYPEEQQQWQRFTNYIEKKGIKAAIGIVGIDLQNNSFCNLVKSLAGKKNFEIWSHGFTHDCVEFQEFKGRPYEEQLAVLQKVQQIIKEKLGVTCHTFGAPCNEIDENTSQALADIPEITVWFFGLNESSKLMLPRKADLENPYGFPDSNYFIENYNQKGWAQSRLLVLQVHPGFWDDRRWTEFEKVMDFLYQKEVVFMTPYEYYQSVTETITVTTASDHGTGSLRAAVDRANNNTANLSKATAVVLPAGTYYLSGTAGEDNNAGGDLDLRADIAVQGAGAATTIIDGNSLDRVFHIHSGRVVLSGVTVRHGAAGYGGGIRVDGGVFTIIDSTITMNTAVDKKSPNETRGGGIYIQNAKAIISNCTVTDNTGYSPTNAKGGGICIKHDRFKKRIDTRNCLMEKNTANTHPTGTGWGGGFYLSIPGTSPGVMVFNNIFRTNTAAVGENGSGGGLYLEEVLNGKVESNIFGENVAAAATAGGNGRGGALAANGGTQFTMTNNLLVNNQAGGAGGGLYLNGYSSGAQRKTIECTMYHNTLADNDRGKGGEGVYAGDYVTLNLADNAIVGHTKGLYKNDTGGASTISADTNLFYNTADPLVGANALLQDPLLTPEFKPGENSPLVDAGKAIPAVKKDLEGNPRPQGKGSDIGCYEYEPDPEPVIALERTRFYFGAEPGGVNCVKGSQWFTISNGGTGELNWTAEPQETWIRVNPTSGSGTARVTVEVNPENLAPGTYAGTITVTAAGAANSPQTLQVYLTIYAPGITAPPFGSMETPAEGTTGISGAIPVTGWALDDIGVEKVEIYCRWEKQELYIGEAVFIEGARPDVEEAFPGYPFNYRAGWGYMLLTNYLPSQGNGTYEIMAIANDANGNRSGLGSRTITCDNAHAVKPFGTIDTPPQGGTISGRRYIDWAWVLTPQPNYIPRDGKTLNVWVDGVKMATSYNYSLYREDIAALFPGYYNSDGACGYFHLNTTNYANGLHSIFWQAKDSAGNEEGIGSRFFMIRNTQGQNRQGNTAGTAQHKNAEKKRKTIDGPVDLLHQAPLRIKTPFRDDKELYPVTPDDDGINRITIKELEPMEIRFPGEYSEIAGYMVVGKNLRPLPAGSTLDTARGIFYWQPGPGFVGEYRLVFILEGDSGKANRRFDIEIEINMKYSTSREP